MSQLPIVNLTLYKHGVGYFQRRGPVTGEAVKLTFRREEMADMLKSLTVIDHTEAGQVRGVDYDTPQTQAEKLAGCSIILDDAASLRDLVRALRGREVTLSVAEGPEVSGQLIGLDDQKNPEKPLVTILQAESESVAVLPMSQLQSLTLRDETAAADLRFFLQTALGQETHRSITIRLNPGEHDLAVSYIAPAPTWRVSYRFVLDAAEAPTETAQKREALLQGWGIFDNQLEEDLTDISLSLTAGMPISFVYDLYTPHTPERPVIEEEERTAAGPIMFDAAAPPPAPPPPEMKFERSAAPMPRKARQAMAASVESAATGQAMGELFQYNVAAPVTVGRGKSAMVPIVSTDLACRKDLIYNGQKMASHPVATIRFENHSGLTLERGPLTVLEGSEYVGEAVLPFTPAQAEAVIAYAVELGVQITEQSHSATKLHSLEIKEKFLWRNSYRIQQVDYQLENRTAADKTVLVEYQLPSGYQLFDTAAPTEQTHSTYRYRVAVPANQQTKFVIKARYLQSERQQWQSLSYQQLQQYAQGQFLDEQTLVQLKELLDLWQAISQHKEQIAAQQQQRQQIYQAQEQVQKNMQVLGSTGEEGQLRQQYVQQLRQHEATLAQIAQQIADLEAEIQQKEAQVEQKLAAL